MAKQKSEVDVSEAKRLERIKRLVVIAMFADDTLMQRFVLKGGNALDLVLHVSTRASLDIDLSMEGDFETSKLPDIRRRVEESLAATFTPEKLRVFDVTLESKPEVLTPDVAGFWGGYLLTFKLIEAARLVAYGDDLNKMRRNSVRIGAKGKFEIDISKFEFCRGKKPEDFDGYRIFVYTPEMIACEKLRAICQQMPEYSPVVKRGRPATARARDFVDIYTLIEVLRLDMLSEGNRWLLKCIFEAKRVPLEFLGKVGEHREFHRPDFEAVRATVKPGVVLQDFDFYFDYVTAMSQRLLKSLGNE